MRKGFQITAVVILVMFCGVVVALISGAMRQEQKLKTHLTIYLDAPITDQGGAIIVAGRPVPEEQWRQVREGENPAEHDLSNPKREQVEQGDQHFGVTVSSSASAVEFVYPENGDFTFNLRSVRDHSVDTLRTKEVLVGSGSVTDPATGEQLDWRNQSVIHVVGTKYDEAWARLMGATLKNALRKARDGQLAIRSFPGARVIELRESAIEEYIVDTK